MEEALGRVQDALLRDPVVAGEVLEHVPEVARVGLVRADVLGGVDGVELDPEPRVARRESRPVHVREDHEAVVLLEIAQGGGGVGEGGPLSDRIAEGTAELGIGLDPPVGRDRIVDAGEDLGIEGVRRLRLLLVLVAAEGGEPFAAVDPAPRPDREGLEGGADSGLPVDEGAVAVEGEGVEVGELDHAVSASRARPRARTSSRVAAGERALGSMTTSMRESPRCASASSRAASNSSSVSTRVPFPP